MKKQSKRKNAIKNNSYQNFKNLKSRRSAEGKLGKKFKVIIKLILIPLSFLYYYMMNQTIIISLVIALLIVFNMLAKAIRTEDKRRSIYLYIIFFSIVIYFVANDLYADNI